MKLDEVYPSNSEHLKAADLNGGQAKVIIESIDIAKFDNGNKIVLKFKGKDKTLVLNKTNAKKIGEYYSDNIDGWIGEEIIIYPDKTDFQGKMVDCLRVRIQAEQSDSNW